MKQTYPSLVFSCGATWDGVSPRQFRSVFERHHAVTFHVLNFHLALSSSVRHNNGMPTLAKVVHDLCDDRLKIIPTCQGTIPGPPIFSWSRALV